MKRTWLGRAGRLALAAAILFGAAGISKAASPAAEEMNLGTKNIHVWRVRGNVYMLVGAGGNIAVQVGETYIIVVDTGLPQYADEVVTTIRNISDLPIIFTGKTGAIGFGNEGFKIYNGEGIVFYKLPNGHTDGDSMCFFRASDVISAGDVFTTTSYPVIETENGGTVIVLGQLIKQGEVNGERYLPDPDDFTLLLVFKRNPDMTRNGRLPLAVESWQLKINNVVVPLDQAFPSAPAHP